MQDEIEKALAEIGGSELVAAWHGEHDQISVTPLPTAYLDSLSIGYAVVIGSVAAALDIALDQAFRTEMAERHRLLPTEEQYAREKVVKKRLRELGVYPEDMKGKPNMAMDWYKDLNEELGLRSPFKLRPANHRILNHTNERAVIKMLMNGEAGFGDLARQMYPKMSETAARELYQLHMAADRSSPASLPLHVMTWLWEQGVRASIPQRVGPPSTLYRLLNSITPNLDWSHWLNKFFGVDRIPEGATLGEAMLKLSDAQTSNPLNQRSFWTSDVGAAVGGAKRRALITAVMELGIELFALLEGVKLGFVSWEKSIQSFGKQFREWRDQPKYVDMRITAQALVSAGSATRALLTGDVLGLNFTSMGTLAKHIWTRPAVGRRHTDRLIQFSQEDSASAIAEFQHETGILIQPNLTAIDGGNNMADLLDARIINSGCLSTRVRVLASRMPREMEPLVERIETLSHRASGDDSKETAFDDLCESWYLADEDNDRVALQQLRVDIERIERIVNG